MFLLSMLVGLVLLVVGAEFLVRGGGNLALALRVPALVVGLTVVAAGTSAPELVVSLLAAWNGSSAIAMSNVNGSNIANVLLVLGLSSMIMPLTVERGLLRRDILACLGLQALLPLLGMDLVFSSTDGFIVVLAGLGYNGWLFYDVYRGRAPAPDDGIEESRAPIWLHLTMVLGGLVTLVFGAQLFVDGAVVMAQKVGLSERFIGLTVVAVGTSAPEIATGLVSTARGESDMAVGNSVGSNIFNVWMVLGFTSMVHPLDLSAGGFVGDMVVALAVTSMLVPIALRGVLGRVEGGLMVLGYLSYIAWGYLSGV